ncbi:cytokine receptor common subunit beta-like isoform X2 [Dermochelys coriacea]|uniref:cytokine receptor common subunit beta-like isoform X2 n=1 Tax=Dermochelys coriacea TaxID=27794 RepID=UPI001CA7E0FE|nr:cytokine receptor common subunit beta-like isoform X2 [Dermochelys coriacea]
MKAFWSALLALCWAFRVGESRETLPMQSLRCYNDYTSQTTCTWQECTEARRFIQVNLHHEDNIDNCTQILCEPQGAEGLPFCHDSCVCWSCHRNSTLFVVGVNDSYTFKPDRLLQAKLSVSLFQNVQTLPPQKHWLSVTEAAWEAAGGRQGRHWLHNALELDMTYKQECESWEKSSSVSVASTSHCLLRRDALVSSSTYVARVRSKPSQGAGWSGQSSKWSTAVSWRSQEGDEAQPKNLCCLFNGVDLLTCSWEVRREVTSSVLFTLFYRTPPASEETECSPVHEEELPGSHYLFHCCVINVTNPSRLSQYLITVQPKKEEKLIEPHKNIMPLAPVNVTMTKRKEQEYELRWTKQILSYTYIGQRYEFLYWKTNDSVENAQVVNISNDKPPFIFTLQMLEPSTCYRGKMRARVHTGNYQGPWSEWSEECTWETESVWSPLILPLLVPVFTIVLIAFGWCGYRGLLSKNQKWEEKIPNPGKSQLLQSYLQKVPLGIPLPSSQLHFGKQSPSEKTDLVCCIQVLDGRMKVSSAELPAAVAERMMCFLGALDPKNPCQTLEMTNPTPHPGTPANCRSSQSTSQSLLPATLPWRSSAKVTASQAPMSCFDFNGPYLHLPHGCSLFDIHQDREAAPLATRGRSVSLEYLLLPQGAPSQTLLVGEERGAAQLHPILLPAEKKMKWPLAGGQEGPQGQPAGGEVAQGDTEGQRSPTAAILNNSGQKRPVGYVTTEGLSLMQARDSAYLNPALAPPEGMLTAAAVLTSNPDGPGHRGHPSPELGPETTDVAVPVPSPALATPSGAHQHAFGSYVTFLKAPQGTSEPMSVS